MIRSLLKEQMDWYWGGSYVMGIRALHQGAQEFQKEKAMISNYHLGKPPALPGDSRSLTVPGVGSSFRASETRPGIQKKYWIPAFAGMTGRATKQNSKCFLVLILTDCGQAPLRGQQS